MPKKRLVELHFPNAGLHTAGPYTGQPPYTAPDCQNVRPDEIYKGRTRGGSRPGLDLAFHTQLGDSGDRKIRMLHDVTTIDRSGFTIYQDSFQGSALGGAWSAASWTTDGLPSVFPDTTSGIEYNSDVGAVLEAQNIDTSQNYMVEMYVVPYEGSYAGKYQLFINMNDNTPNVETDGVIAELVMDADDGTWTGSFKVYNATALTSYAFTAGSSDLGYSPSGWFSVLVNGTTLTAYWRGQTLKSQAVTLGGSAGSRIGYGMECTEEGGICLTDIFRLQYYADDKVENPRNVLIAGCNQALYKESLLHTMGTTSSSLTINDDRMLESTDRSGILYIADHGNPVVDTSATVSGSVVTISGVTTSNASADDCLCELTIPTGDVTAGSYTIASVSTSGGTITLDSAPGDGGCTARVERSVKKFDTSDDSLALLAATAGYIPVGCDCIALYRDRLCLSRDHVCYQSAAGTLTDFNYGADATDATRAVATTISDSETGQLGDIITALIPWADDYMIYGGRNSLWIQIGDVASGGSIDNITRNVGIIDRGAWCWGPAGELVFLSNDGLYMLQSPRTLPISLSEERMPDELKYVDTAIYRISMMYDLDYRGVHLYLSGETDTARRHWWFDWGTKTFWPVKMYADHEPMSICTHYGSSTASRGVLLGCKDGYIRIYNEHCTTDADQEIDNYVLIGPFRLWDQWESGIIQELDAVLADGSGNVTWSLYVGDDAETVAGSTSSFATGTWTEGLNYKVRPRAGGGWGMLRLESASSTLGWAMEKVFAVLEQRGEQKKY